MHRSHEAVIALASYERYDPFADAVASIDAKAIAKVYRVLYPVIDGAYRELGDPAASLDVATAAALRRIQAAPVEAGEIRVERKERGALFAFAEPRLEELGDLEKQLLRMGPRNMRLLQAKAHEIEQALGLPAAVHVAEHKP